MLRNLAGPAVLDFPQKTGIPHRLRVRVLAPAGEVMLRNLAGPAVLDFPEDDCGLSQAERIRRKREQRKTLQLYFRVWAF